MQDSTQLLQRYDGGDDGASEDDGAAAAADDPDEVQLDGGVYGDDLPSPGRNSPWQKSVCRRDLSLSVFSAPQRWRNLSVVAPLVLGF